MTVQDLVKEIDDCRKKYGDDFLSWDVYTEQIDAEDREGKKQGGDWKFFTDSEDWEYCECAGFWTKFPKKRIFTINVNF